MMCELAKSQTKPHNTEIMLPDNLHCTSHVVMELDKQYGKDWFEGEKGETEFLKNILDREYVRCLSQPDRKTASFFP